MRGVNGPGWRSAASRIGSSRIMVISAGQTITSMIHAPRRSDAEIEGRKSLTSPYDGSVRMPQSEWRKLARRIAKTLKKHRRKTTFVLLGGFTLLLGCAIHRAHQPS